VVLVLVFVLVLLLLPKLVVRKIRKASVIHRARLLCAAEGFAALWL
jgi:hypothetical protein